MQALSSFPVRKKEMEKIVQPRRSKNERSTLDDLMVTGLHTSIFGKGSSIGLLVLWRASGLVIVFLSSAVIG